MTTIIRDLRENSEFAARQWKIYLAATRRIGDAGSLREANEGLGYNLVKTIPGLLARIEELEQQLYEEQNRVRLLPRTTIEPDAKGDRPLGIPADHIILKVTDDPELEVVTEAAPIDTDEGVFYTG